MFLNLCELLCFLIIEYLLQCVYLKHSLGNIELGKIIIAIIVIASRWFQANSAQISSLKVSMTKLPALEMEQQARGLGESNSSH